MRKLSISVPWIVVVVLVGGGLWLHLTGRLHFGDAPPPARAVSDDAPAGDVADAARIDGNTVTINADAAVAMHIKTAAVATGSVATQLRVPAEVRLAEDRVAHITPRVPGTIREVRKNLGDAVLAGEALCIVDSTELGDAKASYVTASADVEIAARNQERWRALEKRSYRSEAEPLNLTGWVDLDQALADYASAESDEALAKRIHLRWQELHTKGLKTETELWQADSDVRRAELKVESTRRRLAVLGVAAANAVSHAEVQLDAAAGKLRALGVVDAAFPRAVDGKRPIIDGRYAVCSPIAGVVLDRHATLGENIDAKDHGFLVGDLSEIWVIAALHDKDVAAVKLGMPASVSVLGVAAESLPGVVANLGNLVDEKTRTVPVRVVVRNPLLAAGGTDRPLRPGMFATVDIEVTRHDNVVVVPSSALFTVDDRPVVFLRAARAPTESGRNVVSFEKRDVKLGLRDERAVEILAGLKVGDEAVVENGFLLKSEFEKSRMGEGE